MSAWWLLTLVPAFLLGAVVGWGKAWLAWRDSTKGLATQVHRLLLANNQDRAIRLLKVAQGISDPVQKVQFDDALKELKDA